MTLIATEAATEEATFDLTYEGLIAANTEGDDPDDTTTLRIHGQDTIKAVAAATRGLRHPIIATVTLDGQVVASGRLHVHRGESDSYGCPDGCCADYSENEWTVGDVDVLEHLESLHGGTHEVRIHGQGYVEPLIEVQLAHYTSHAPGARPMDLVSLPLGVASRLYSRVTPWSWDRIEAALRARDAR